MTTSPDRLAYKPAEAAELLGVSRATLNRLVKTGELPSVVLGPRTRLITTKAIDEFSRPDPAGANMTTDREISNVVANNVDRLRFAQELSMADLVRRMKENGKPGANPGYALAIATGRRRIDVDELVVLAKVFGVAPGDLLRPLNVKVVIDGKDAA